MTCISVPFIHYLHFKAILWCHSLLSVIVKNTMTKSKLEEERADTKYRLQIQTIINGSQDTNLETRTGTDSWGILIIDFFLLAFSATIRIKPRSITPGMAPCTLAWALSNQLTIYKVIHRHDPKPTWWAQFQNRGPHFLELSSWQLG